MKIVVGLGNPGPDYERTRHNVGWWVVDHFADVWRFEGWKRDGEARVASGIVHGQRVRLVKPQTYMNLSGAALRPYLRREVWDKSRDLLVVVDEVALPVGTFRIRARGSAGGHNGLKSVESALQSPTTRVSESASAPRIHLGGPVISRTMSPTISASTNRKSCASSCPRSPS